MRKTKNRIENKILGLAQLSDDIAPVKRLLKFVRKQKKFSFFKKIHKSKKCSGKFRTLF